MMSLYARVGTPNPKPPKQTIVYTQVFIAVANYYNVPIDLMTSKCREARFVKARQMAWKLSREANSYTTFQQLAGVGGFNHTSIIKGVRHISDIIDTEEPIRNDYLKLKELIGIK